MPYYLSKLLLSPRCRLALRDMGSPYEMHRTIMRAFPDRDSGGPGRVLFRLEPQAQGQPPVVIVQSEKLPDWSALAKLEGYLIDSAVKEWQPALRAGQRLHFRLRANPTVKQQGKRHALLSDDQQFQWLNRKAATAGFRVVDSALRRPGRLVSARKDGPNRLKATHYAVDFEGVLEVAEPDALTAALLDGIGPAKGFGFGLLSLARA